MSEAEKDQADQQQHETVCTLQPQNLAETHRADYQQNSADMESIGAELSVMEHSDDRPTGGVEKQVYCVPHGLFSTV